MMLAICLYMGSISGRSSNVNRNRLNTRKQITSNPINNNNRCCRKVFLDRNRIINS